MDTQPKIGKSYRSKDSENPFLSKGEISTIKEIKNGYVLYDQTGPNGKSYKKPWVCSHSIEDFWVLHEK